jgi:hypothetical protein
MRRANYWSRRFHVPQILTTVLVAVQTAPALAHALGITGKDVFEPRRVSNLSTIYYPGFTIAGGIAEAGGLVASIVFADLHATDRKRLGDRWEYSHIVGDVRVMSVCRRDH